MVNQSHQVYHFSLRAYLYRNFSIQISTVNLQEDIVCSFSQTHLTIGPPFWEYYKHLHRAKVLHSFAKDCPGTTCWFFK